MNERHTVKRLTHQNVIRFFVCLLVAFFLWFYVMYTENPEYDQKYTDIRVELRGYTPDYEHDIEFPATIDAVFRGTNVDLSQCKSEDIVAVINFPTEFTSSGDRSVTVGFEFLNDVTLTPLKEVRTTLSLKDADIREEVFENVPVEVTGQAGSQVETYKFEALAVPMLTVRGRTEDLELLKKQGIKATASLSPELINDIHAKVNDDKVHDFTVSVTVTLPAVGMTCWATQESSVVYTMVSVRNPNAEAEVQTNAEMGEVDGQTVNASEIAS